MNSSFEYFFGDHTNLVNDKLDELIDNKIASRIWAKDHTVWNQNPEEISNRLGWLDCYEVSSKSLDEINDFKKEIINDGFKNVLVLGMGGSSLAPEVYSKVFSEESENGLKLNIVDSTDPTMIKTIREKYNPVETLYIVSTKSGGTVETLSFAKYFYNEVYELLGDKASSNFVAITDPGSGLQTFAEELKFKKIFLNDPDIGGRYSALSLFGLVPAALAGVDIAKLLDEAELIMKESIENNSENNTSLFIGAVMGVMNSVGKNKITFIVEDQFKPFGAWAEQLIAESTGKHGKGILPIDLEPISKIENYSNDRLFVFISINNEHYKSEIKKNLKLNNHPYISIDLDSVYKLGSEFFRWEFATVIAGHMMNIQPFDQPNVESAKISARKMMQEYIENGKLPELKENYSEDRFKVYSNNSGSDIKELIKNFINNRNDKSYLCIQSFITPTVNRDVLIDELRKTLLKKYKLPTTAGYGPRFLHSTGQLHKGDDGNGLFIQFTEEINNDIDIPENAKVKTSQYSFGTLLHSQALGDREALLQNNRKLLKFHFTQDVENGMKDLIEMI